MTPFNLTVMQFKVLEAALNATYETDLEWYDHDENYVFFVDQKGEVKARVSHEAFHNKLYVEDMTMNVDAVDFCLTF